MDSECRHEVVMLRRMDVVAPANRPCHVLCLRRIFQEIDKAALVDRSKKDETSNPIVSVKAYLRVNRILKHMELICVYTAQLNVFSDPILTQARSDSFHYGLLSCTPRALPVFM